MNIKYVLFVFAVLCGLTAFFTSDIEIYFAAIVDSIGCIIAIIFFYMIENRIIQ